MHNSIKIPSQWLTNRAIRLDASYYASEGQREARVFVASKKKKSSLDSLTKGGRSGIFIGGRFQRRYVPNPDKGLPFFTGSGIMECDPYATCKHVSRKLTADIEKLRIRNTTTVVSRSGTVGNIRYVNRYLDGAIGSDDLIRIVPDKASILPGYLFSFLASKVGKALLTQNTYGSVVQHIEAHHLYDLPVPILQDKTMQRIHDLIDEAASLRTSAHIAIGNCRQSLLRYFKLPETNNSPYDSYSTRIVSVKDLVLAGRFKADFFSTVAATVEEHLNKHKKILSTLGACTKSCFKPPIFRRLRVEHSNGFPFMGQSEPYEVNPKPKYYLSFRQPDYEEFMLKKGMVVLPAAGSTNGNFGTPLFIGQKLEKVFCGDDLLRIVPQSQIDGAYVFIFLSTWLGQILIKRLNYGSAIPRIVPEMARTIPILWPEDKERKAISGNVISATASIDRACMLEDQAIGIVEKELS